MIPAVIAKIRYSVPMSLWFVDMNQRAKEARAVVIMVVMRVIVHGRAPRTHWG